MERLRELRVEKELSQTQLAIEMGTCQTAISKYEKSERQPDFQMLKKLCDFFGVSAGYILGFEDY